MAITAAISDFFNSIYELLASVVGTFISIIQSFFSVILGFFRSILNLFTDLVSGLVDVAGGVGKFVAGNVVILAIGAAAAITYVKYTAQGQRVANKKTQ